jgi:hypothetical protein
LTGTAFNSVTVYLVCNALRTCLLQVGGAMSSLRQVQAGRQYQLPPPVNGIPPSTEEPLSSLQDNITRAAALAAAEQAAAPSRKAAAAAGSAGAVAPAPRETVLSGATRAYMGVSPALVEELCATAGISPTASPDSLSAEAWQAFHIAWQAWLDRLHSGNFTPSSCPATGKFSVIGSYSQPHESAHDMVEGYYHSLQAGEVYAGLHQRLSTAVKQALKKARGRVKSFEHQLQAADEVSAVQKQADIIVANIYRCELMWCKQQLPALLCLPDRVCSQNPAHMHALSQNSWSALLSAEQLYSSCSPNLAFQLASQAANASATQQENLRTFTLASSCCTTRLCSPTCLLSFCFCFLQVGVKCNSAGG